MYFRTDMNAVIASGHVMRCLAIAEGFQKRGESCTFILSDNTAVELIKGRGFQTVILNSQWNQLEEELPRMLSYIQEHEVEKLIVDSYSATKKYLHALNQATSVVYIDDFQEDVYDVDTLLAFCLGDKREDFFEKAYAGKHTTVLQGSQYAPLRAEFQKIDKADKPLSYDVMITTGGTDTYGMAQRLVEAFRKNYPQLKLLVLSARMDTRLNDECLTILPFSNRMAELMTASKVVVSASGGTLYELCACKTPTIAFSLADNQLAFAKRMHELGAVCYVGDARSKQNITQEIVENVNDLLNDKERYQAMVECMSAVTDGCGVDRIVSVLMGK